MELPATFSLPDFTRVRKMRVIECRQQNADVDFEREINECLDHGWRLLVIQPGESYAKIFLGWEHLEEPPQTEQQKRSQAYLKAVVFDPAQG